MVTGSFRKTSNHKSAFNNVVLSEAATQLTGHRHTFSQPVLQCFLQFQQLFSTDFFHDGTKGRLLDAQLQTQTKTDYIILYQLLVLPSQFRFLEQGTVFTRPFRTPALGCAGTATKENSYASMGSFRIAQHSCPS